MNIRKVAKIYAIMLIMHSRQIKKKRRRVQSRNWILTRQNFGMQFNIIKTLEKEDVGQFKNFFRMSPKIFEYLLSLVGPIICKQDTPMRKSIPPEHRLMITLRYLATGETQTSLQYQFIVRQNTISGIIAEVCDTLYVVLKDEHLKFPSSSDDWRAIALDFWKTWNFPNCIGALDGKHIQICPPSTAGSLYFNYKHTHSIVLMAVVDANYKFIYVDLGGNGRISDGGIFNRTIFKKALDNKTIKIPPPENLPNSNTVFPYCLIGDDAFPLSNYLMKPFSKKNLTVEENNFNYRLSRARRVVENAFGILSNRFRILLKPINLYPEKAIDVTMACIALHNFLRSSVMSEHGNETEYCTSTSTAISQIQIQGRDNNNGKILRNELKDYLILNKL